MNTNPTSTPTPFNEPGADIDIISSDQIHFRAHKHILSTASPIFEGMFSLPTSPPLPGPDADQLPPVHVSEPGEVVEQLLRFSYPNLHGSVATTSVLRQLFTAAEKYEMEGVKAQLTSALRWQFTDKEPHLAYAIACLYALPDQAKVAAHQTLSSAFPGPPLTEYDELPASAYHRLVVYRQRCIKLIDTVLNDWRYQVWGKSQDLQWTKCHSCPKRGDGMDFVAYWFFEHLERTRAAYKAKPRGSTIHKLASKLAQQTVDSHATVGCPCASRASLQLVEFNDKLAKVMDNKINSVCHGFFHMHRDEQLLTSQTDTLCEAIGFDCCGRSFVDVFIWRQMRFTSFIEKGRCTLELK